MQALAVLLVICSVGAGLLASQARGASYVEGISDQGMPAWEGTYTDGSYFNNSFPNFFFSAWVGSPASHLKYARYVIPWNITDNSSSTCYANFASWYHEVLNAGLIPEVSLWTYPRIYGSGQKCSPGGAAMLPTSATEYAQNVETASTSLLKQFPGIKYLEAWNEPNLGGENPSVAAAAEYGREAARLCSGICTSIAGDLIDTSGMQGYEETYVSDLTKDLGGDPGVWGIHPYAATNYKELAPVTTFKAHLPNQSDPVYFTEVGAYYCQYKEGHENLYGAAAQAEDAEYLTTKLMPYAARVFYYEFAYGHDALTPCSSTSDTALYAPSGSTETPRPAARVIFGPEGGPSATTGSASGVTTTQATLSGSVTPGGIANTEYYFQYGPSTNYGAETGRSHAESLNSVPASYLIGGLEEETEYHYRLVAVNADGVSYGSDHTVITTGRVMIAVQGANHSLDFYTGYDNEPWHEETIGGEGSTYSAPSLVRFSDRFGKGEQLVVEGKEHSLLFYTKYDGGSWTNVEIAAPGWAFGTPSMVRFNDKYGTGVQLLVEGPEHQLDFYSDYDNEPWTAGGIAGVNTTYGSPSLVRFNDKYGTGLQALVPGPNNTLDFYTNYDNQPWTEATITGAGAAKSDPSLVRFNDKYGTGLQGAIQGGNNSLTLYTGYDNNPWGEGPIAGAGTSYSSPAMVRFNDSFGTGLQLAEQGKEDTLDFYTAYDNQPWTEATIGGGGTTYGTPALLRFSDRYGTGLQLAVQGKENTLDFYNNYDNQPWTEATIGGAGSTYGTPSIVRLHPLFQE